METTTLSSFSHCWHTSTSEREFLDDRSKQTCSLPRWVNRIQAFIASWISREYEYVKAHGFLHLDTSSLILSCFGEVTARGTGMREEDPFKSHPSLSPYRNDIRLQLKPNIIPKRPRNHLSSKPLYYRYIQATFMKIHLDHFQELSNHFETNPIKAWSERK